jgi:WD40 repeat protein
MSEEPEMANADEAPQQDMQQEPPQKLIQRQTYQTPLILMGRVAPTEHDLSVFERDQPVIRDGYPMASWSPDGGSLAFSGDQYEKPETRSFHLFDLKTGQISQLPDSAGMRSPRWSPHGDLIAGISADGSIQLYDIRMRKQSEPLTKGTNPVWSRDGEFLYFSFGAELSPKNIKFRWGRLRISDRKVEYAGGTNIQLADWGWWFVLGPDGSVISARSIGAGDIYALNWDLR